MQLKGEWFLWEPQRGMLRMLRILRMLRMLPTRHHPQGCLKSELRSAQVALELAVLTQLIMEIRHPRAVPSLPPAAALL